MKKTMSLLVFGVVLATWDVAVAMERPPLPPIETALDANSDGVIDAEEISNAPKSLLALDKDGDGSLSKEECMPPPPEGCAATKAPRGDKCPPPPPIPAALDVNQDGVIDAEEIANASAQLLTLDKNSDGQLSMDETRPPRPCGKGAPPPPPSGE